MVLPGPPKNSYESEFLSLSCFFQFIFACHSVCTMRLSSQPVSLSFRITYWSDLHSSSHALGQCRGKQTKKSLSFIKKQQQPRNQKKNATPKMKALY